MIMKTRLLASSFFLLPLISPVCADTIVLKDGTSLEGSVLREDPTSYFVEVQVTKSIKDERVIAKADVAKIQREQPDLVAFEELRKLSPAPDLLSAEDYGIRIRAFEKFLVDHRGSDKSKEAREIIAALKAEANEVLAGGVKMNGKIVPPAEYRANAYDIDARIQESRIRSMVKEAKYLPALRAFNDFSRDFRNTSAHAAIIPLINQVITTYTAEISQSLATYDARVKEREVGLQRMPATDRSGTESAIREETTELEALLKSEKDSKIGWVTPHPYYKPSLEETMSFAKSETTRLASMKTAATVDAGKIYRDALALIMGNGDKTAITAAITAAKSALIPPRYIANLENAARATGAIK